MTERRVPLTVNVTTIGMLLAIHNQSMLKDHSFGTGTREVYRKQWSMT